MLTAQSSPKSKITAYESGADLYLTKPVDFPELLASINSILGRLTTSPAGRQELKENDADTDNEHTQWRLLRSEWTLLTPKGEKIVLTAKEFDLIEKLASNPNQIVERQFLLKTLDYENDEFGNRSLDALIHRLRRKKDGLNCRIPIKTAHGSGYCFSEPIVIA